MSNLVTTCQKTLISFFFNPLVLRGHIISGQGVFRVLDYQIPSLGTQ